MTFVVKYFPNQRQLGQCLLSITLLFGILESKLHLLQFEFPVVQYFGVKVANSLLLTFFVKESTQSSLESITITLQQYGCQYTANESQ